MYSQLLVDLVDGFPGIGPHAVQFIYERYSGDVVSPHLPVDCRGLRLHPRDCTQYHYSAVQHPQSPLDFNCKINMPRRVNQIDVVFLLLAILRLEPVAKCGSRLDGDALLPLEIHRVHLGAHGIFATDFVYRFDSACVEEDSFRGGGFAAVDMGLIGSMR